MFAGFLDEGVGGTIPVQLTDGSGNPVEPDAAPTFRVYGANGVVAGGVGTASSLETGTVTGATDASPIVITSALNNVSDGQAVTVSGVGGNTAANGAWVATSVSGDTFSLNGSSGNAAYTSGGSWKTTGLYGVAIAGAMLASLAAGGTYTLVVYYLLSGVQKSIQLTFTVR